VAFGEQRRYLFVHSRIFAQQGALQHVAHFRRALVAAEDVDELLLPVVGQVAEVALHVSVVAYCVGVDGCHVCALVARHYCEEHLFVNHVGADVRKTESVAVEVVIPEKAEYLIAVTPEEVQVVAAAEAEVVRRDIAAAQRAVELRREFQSFDGEEFPYHASVVIRTLFLVLRNEPPATSSGSGRGRYMSPSMCTNGSVCMEYVFILANAQWHVRQSNPSKHTTTSS